MTGVEMLMLAGTAVSTAGTLAAGSQADANAGVAAANEETISEFEAEQLEDKARQERGVSRKAARGRRKEAELLTSRQTAIVAASGGDTTSSTVLDILTDTELHGEELAQSELFQGEEKARGYLDQASSTRAGSKARSSNIRAEGKAAKTKSRFNAASTVLSGAAKSPTVKSGFG